MRIPKVHGTIKRRLLVNFRVDPSTIQRQLPAPFRPKLHEGYAVAGICLIRLEDIRPSGFPRVVGLSSENAAHRIAVVWEDVTGWHEGVFIPRRDTDSLVNCLAGGRLFPGEHNRAKFSVDEDARQIALHMLSADGQIEIDVVGQQTDLFSTTSIFRTTAEASKFFQSGSLGYSVTASGQRLDGIVLKTDSWRVSPLSIEHVSSSYFDNTSMFPPGSVQFDCALVMRDILHRWESAPGMQIKSQAVQSR